MQVNVYFCTQTCQLYLLRAWSVWLLLLLYIILTALQGPLRELSEFHLNLRYNNKRTKLKILPVTRAELVQVRHL